MSGNAAPVTVHAGIFVQSRLPIVLHRIIPSGTLSLHNIGMLEAAIFGNLIYMTFLRESYAPMDMVEMLMAGGVGAGLYHMAPP